MSPLTWSPRAGLDASQGRRGDLLPRLSVGGAHVFVDRSMSAKYAGAKSEFVVTLLVTHEERVVS